VLPADYVPGPFDVLCSRGLEAHKHNNVFRGTMQMNMSRYVAAKSTHEKNALVDTVINVFRQRSLIGGFIRRDPVSGLYFAVGGSCARRKVSRAFQEMAQERMKGQSHRCRSSDNGTIILQNEMEPFEESSGSEEGEDEDVNDVFVSPHVPTWENTSPVSCRSFFDPSDFNMTRNARDLLEDDDDNIDDIPEKASCTFEHFVDVRQYSSAMGMSR
jgi:hypothetical protein